MNKIHDNNIIHVKKNKNIKVKIILMSGYP